MDHILENNDDPVPDLSVVSHSDPPKNSTSGDAMDEDDDDAAVLRAAIGLSTSGASQAGGAEVSATAEAKVRIWGLAHPFLLLRPAPCPA
jgi:UBX domain-containing protein 1/4